MAIAKRLLRQAPGILAPMLLVLGLAALALAGLDQVPAYLQPGTVPQEFASVEAAERALGIRIPVPAYFPDYLAWPATSVVGRQRPGPQVTLTFSSRDGGGMGLVLHVAAGGSTLPALALPVPAEVVSSREIDFEGVPAVLVTGREASGRPYNRLSWASGGYSYVLITPQPVAELLRMARSVGR